MSTDRKKFRLHDSLTIFPIDNYTGLSTKCFEILSGARLVFTLFVESLDPGASVNIDIKNGFSLDVPFDTILNINTDKTGYIKQIITDFHSFFDIDLTVIGGSAKVALGLHVHDNAFLRFAGTGADVIPSLGTNLFYDDMSPANGGIARGTTLQNGDGFVDVFNFVGNGLLLGFIITLEELEKDWLLRLIIDEQEVFGVSGISTLDLEKNDIYGFDQDTTKDLSEWIGFSLRGDQLRWAAPLDLPLKYDESINIKLERTGNSKKFRAGLVAITKR